MEEINLKELFEYFGKNISKILIGVFGLMILGFSYVLFLQTPMYEASTTLLLTTEETIITQGDITVNRSLIQTYREVVKSNKILTSALERTTYDLTINDLSKMVEVTAIPNTDILKIRVRSDDPNQPHILANIIAHDFKEMVQEVYNIKHISVVDEASLSKNPYNQNIVLQSVIITLISVLVTSFITLLIYFLDDTIKDEKAIEETFDVPVIGIIPIEKGAQKWKN